MAIAHLSIVDRAEQAAETSPRWTDRRTRSVEDAIEGRVAGGGVGVGRMPYINIRRHPAWNGYMVGRGVVELSSGSVRAVAGTKWGAFEHRCRESTSHCRFDLP